MRCRHFRAYPALAIMFAGGLSLVVCPGCLRTDSLPTEDPARLTIQLRSPAFSDGGMIPKVFTCDGSDRSPPLEWSGVPAAARSLALVCDDPDAPLGTWSHWVVFNLASQIMELKEGLPAEEMISVGAGKARQGKNNFGKIGYGGPCPPSGTHRYFFRLYALDCDLKLNSKATRADILKAIQGHIVAEGRLIGKYQRGGKE